MEFCPGGDLYAAIKKGHMSPSEVECCFKQILTGVSYLHNQGVAHRDIKPENLFFDTQGHLKVCLFPRLALSDYPNHVSIFRSVTMVLRRCTVSRGSRPCTCRRVCVAANHTSHQSSFWENVSSLPHPRSSRPNANSRSSIRCPSRRYLGMRDRLLLSPFSRNALARRKDIRHTLRSICSGMYIPPAQRRPFARQRYAFCF